MWFSLILGQLLGAWIGGRQSCGKAVPLGSRGMIERPMMRFSLASSQPGSWVRYGMWFLLDNVFSFSPCSVPYLLFAHVPLIVFCTMRREAIHYRSFPRVAVWGRSLPLPGPETSSGYHLHHPCDFARPLPVCGQRGLLQQLAECESCGGWWRWVMGFSPPPPRLHFTEEIA